MFANHHSKFINMLQFRQPTKKISHLPLHFSLSLFLSLSFQLQFLKDPPVWHVLDFTVHTNNVGACEKAEFD